MSSRLNIAPVVDSDWGVARNDIQDDLNKFGACCIALDVPNATLESNYFSVGFGGVSPEACEFLTVVLVNGSVYWSFDGGANWLEIYLASTSEQAAFGTGSIVAYAGDPANVPADWLLCDGSEVSRTTYADLFAKVGEIYGNGNGTTTFNIPEMRGQSPFGANYSGLPNGSTGTWSTRNQADAIGEETHQLTESEMPVHNHTTNAGGYPTVTAGAQSTSDNSNANSSSTGGDTAHENMSPFGVAHFIIRT